MSKLFTITHFSISAGCRWHYLCNIVYYLIRRHGVCEEDPHKLYSHQARVRQGVGGRGRASKKLVDRPVLDVKTWFPHLHHKPKSQPKATHEAVFFWPCWVRGRSLLCTRYMGRQFKTLCLAGNELAPSLTKIMAYGNNTSKMLISLGAKTN